MKLRIVTGVAMLFFIMQTSAFALSGQEVYDKYKQTEKKMEKGFKSLIMTLEMNTSGAIHETTIYQKGKKVRVESVVKESNNPMMGKPGQKILTISDGVTTTIFHPTMGKMTNPVDNDDENPANIRKISYLGKEKASGLQCHKIKVVFNFGDQETLWISTKGYALVKEKSDSTVTLNSNFKKINGFMIPQKTVTYEDGDVEQTSVVTSVKTDVRIANSKFDPNAVKGFKSKVKRSPSKANDNVETGMDMMSMVMEIQRLHMAGETEKAEALTKKLKKMQMDQ